MTESDRELIERLQRYWNTHPVCKDAADRLEELASENERLNLAYNEMYSRICNYENDGPFVAARKQFEIENKELAREVERLRTGLLAIYDDGWIEGLKSRGQFEGMTEKDIARWALEKKGGSDGKWPARNVASNERTRK